MNMRVLTVVNGLVKTDGSLLITPATSFHKSHGPLLLQRLARTCVVLVTLTGPYTDPSFTLPEPQHCVL